MREAHLTHGQPLAGGEDARRERAHAAATPWLSRSAAWLALNAGWIGITRFFAPLYSQKLRSLGAQSFHVHAEDGTALHAIHIPPQQEAIDDPRLPIVMLHGWIEIKEFHLHRAEQLARQGHAVVMFDHRGHGRSGRAPATFGPHERRDLQAVIEDARRRGILSDRIITMGHSMGAATALQHAADDPSVVGVVAFAPYGDLRTAIDSFKARIPGLRRISNRWACAGFEDQLGACQCCLDDTSTLQAVARLESPVLLIEGGRDTLTPPPMHSRRLLKAKRQGGVELLRVDEADHFTLTRQGWPGLDDGITRFCAGLA